MINEKSGERGKRRIDSNVEKNVLNDDDKMG